MKKEVIERFFNKQCSASEAKQVAAFLKANPAELDKYLYVNEWHDAGMNERISAAFSEEMWGNIKDKKKASATILWLKRYAIAASVAGMICIGYYHLSYTDTKKNVVASALQEYRAVPGSSPRKVTNNSKKIVKLVLPDSSIAELSPGAAVKYDNPFQNNRRDIFLSGEAMFSVSKDKTKPFTVYAGSLTTTALGTIFKVRAARNTGGNVNVKLFTGKVIIKSLYTGLKGWDKDIYLLPGQQMQYNAHRMLVAVDIITNKKPTAKNPAEKYLPVAGNGLTFDGTALTDVIDRLSKFFTTKIKFDRAEIQAMNFTGTVNKDDSLTNILQLICQMNALEIVKKDDTLIIQKIATSKPPVN